MKHQEEPEPKRVTITIESPDEDGDYQVRVKTEGNHWKSEDSTLRAREWEAGKC